MTSPKQAFDTDHGRYYSHPAHPGKQFVSITNVLSSIAKPALVPAAVKITAETAVDLLPTLVASALVKACNPKRVADECGRCTPCLTKAIKRQYKVQWEYAADNGTLVHHHAWAHLTGEQVAATDEELERVEPFIGQYLRFLADFDIDITRHIEAAELTVAHPALGVAGTLDVLAYLRLDGYLDGKVKQLPDDRRALWVYDIKTSLTKPADTIYDEQPLQLAAQRHATECWLPDGSIVPMPRGIVGGAILNLRQDAYEFIPVPCGQPEWKAYQGFITGTQWLHQDHAKALRPVQPSGRIKAKATRARKTAAKKTAPAARKVA